MFKLMLMTALLLTGILAPAQGAGEKSGGKSRRRTSGRRPTAAGDASKRSFRLGHRGGSRTLWPTKCEVSVHLHVSDLASDTKIVHQYNTTEDLSKRSNLRDVYAAAVRHIEVENNISLAEFKEPNPMSAEVGSSLGSETVQELRGQTDPLNMLCKYHGSLTFILKTKYCLARANVRVAAVSRDERDVECELRIDENSTMTVAEAADEFARQAVEKIGAVGRYTLDDVNGAIPDKKIKNMFVFHGSASALENCLQRLLDFNANLIADEIVRVPINVEFFHYAKVEKNQRTMCIFRAKPNQSYDEFRIVYECLVYLQTKKIEKRHWFEYFSELMLINADGQRTLLRSSDKVANLRTEGKQLHIRATKENLHVYCDDKFIRKKGLFPETTLLDIYQIAVQHTSDRLKTNLVKVYKSEPHKLSSSWKTYKSLDVKLYEDLIEQPELHIVFHSR